ncbi:MAG: hypothetical protein NTV34_16500 [Proteobacteria bacterium]|nr:hypothetical protein [Pseudomonadota bacterium]
MIRKFICTSSIAVLFSTSIQSSRALAEEGAPAADCAIQQDGFSEGAITLFKSKKSQIYLGEHFKGGSFLPNGSALIELRFDNEVTILTNRSSRAGKVFLGEIIEQNPRKRRIFQLEIHPNPSDPLMGVGVLRIGDAQISGNTLSIGKFSEYAVTQCFDF